MTITGEQYMSIVRTVLNVAGGVLVTNGTMTDSTVQMLSGIAIPLATALWGIFVHSPAETVKRADELKSKGVV